MLAADLFKQADSPLFQPLHGIIDRLNAQCLPTLADFNALLDERSITTHSGHALRFVEQALGKLAFEAQYEPRCYLTGEVQNRADNLHDLFNSLVWLTFPKSKAAINARHYSALTTNQFLHDEVAHTNHSQRGAIRDTNTLLDESGIIIPYCNAKLAELLRSFQWKTLFWQHRAEVLNQMGFYIFGHGLYEKSLRPYIGITGQGLLLPVEPAFFSWSLVQRLAHLDEQIAAYLADDKNCRVTRELAPLPLLGVPGWASENECATYYDNKNYFRDGRKVKTR